MIVVGSEPLLGNKFATPQAIKKYYEEIYKEPISYDEILTVIDKIGYLCYYETDKERVSYPDPVPRLSWLKSVTFRFVDELSLKKSSNLSQSTV